MPKDQTQGGQQSAGRSPSAAPPKDQEQDNRRSAVMPKDREQDSRQPSIIPRDQELSGRQASDGPTGQVQSGRQSSDRPKGQEQSARQSGDGPKGQGQGRQPSNKPNTQEQSAPQSNQAPSAVQDIPRNIQQCEKLLKTIFGKSTDIVLSSFISANGLVLMAYVDGLVNKDLIDRDIVMPLKDKSFNGNIPAALFTPCQEVMDIDFTVGEILNGNVAVFYGDSGKAFIVDFKQWDKRAVEPPESEAVLRGPREGFNENFRTNTSLIRRKIKTPKLIIENLSLGRQTNTMIALAYIDGIVNKDVLAEVRLRLSEIDTDAILESGYIEQYLDRNFLSLISTVGETQKPDILAAKILEGRVGIICDGSPHVLTVPRLFIENLQTGDDYYERAVAGTFMRLIRFLALFISVLIPGLFVAITTYHQEMIPTVFLSTITSSVEKTPLPVGAEVFFLTIMFELLKESGTRLPRAIGSAVSIVGALIIGDAAVSAGIVSAPVVIVVALTAVCSFVLPSLDEFITIYRLVLLFLGGTMGLIGVASGVTVIMAQVLSIESFGVPIFAARSKEEAKDSLVRFPLWTMKYRPLSIAKDNKRRQK